MTLRLIGLMSVLLFLALSAFSLLLSHSEEAIMSQVRETVSTAGSGTLMAIAEAAQDFRAKEIPGPPGSDGEFWLSDREECSLTPDMLTRMHATKVTTRRRAARFQRETSDGVIEDYVWTDASPNMAFTIALDADIASHAGETQPRPAGPDQGDPPAEQSATVVSSGAMLRTLRPKLPVRVVDENGEMRVTIELERSGVAKSGEDAAGTSRAIQDHGATAASTPVSAPSTPADAPSATDPRREGDAYAVVFASRLHGSINAPPPPDLPASIDLATAAMPVSTGPVWFRVSTRDYGAVFAAVRERMWILGLLVFAVGAVCAVGLSRLLTRPVRELDRALRRLAGDDLDVRVEERGGGEVARLARAFNDLTGRLRIARDRSRDLARREKLSSLGQLAAGVAHDVRNPLHSINLTLQHLYDTCQPEKGSEDEFRRSISLIRDEVRRLDGLVGNFLRFARREPADAVPVRLGDLLSQTAELVGKEARLRGVRVEVDVDPVDVDVPASPESLRAAVLNLVLNSLDAMQDGGVLTLRSRITAEHAIIEVADTGVGIAAEDQERVFDFGYTTRESGHGLGLAMVHQIVVEEHGGRVSLSSRQGDGTTFCLELPRRVAALEVA